jgi:hypothetical protein
MSAAKAVVKENNWIEEQLEISRETVSNWSAAKKVAAGVTENHLRIVKRSAPGAGKYAAKPKGRG